MSIDPITQMLKNIEKDMNRQMEDDLGDYPESAPGVHFNYDYSGWMDSLRHVPEPALKDAMMEVAKKHADDPEILALVQPLLKGRRGIGPVNAILILMQCAWYLNEIERIKERNVGDDVGSGMARVHRNNSDGTVRGHSWHSR